MKDKTYKSSNIYFLIKTKMKTKTLKELIQLREWREKQLRYYVKIRDKKTVRSRIKQYSNYLQKIWFWNQEKIIDHICRILTWNNVTKYDF